MISASDSTLGIRAKRRWLLFRINVAKHCDFPLLSFSMSFLLGGPVDYIHLFEGASPLADPVVLLSFPSDGHVFVADIRLLYVLQGFRFDFREMYSAYFSNFGLNWENKADVVDFVT